MVRRGGFIRLGFHLFFRHEFFPDCVINPTVRHICLEAPLSVIAGGSFLTPHYIFVLSTMALFQSPSFSLWVGILFTRLHIIKVCFSVTSSQRPTSTSPSKGCSPSLLTPAIYQWNSCCFLVYCPKPWAEPKGPESRACSLNAQYIPFQQFRVK